MLHEEKGIKSLLANGAHERTALRCPCTNSKMYNLLLIVSLFWQHEVDCPVVICMYGQVEFVC